ncbi:PHP domain-containing protein, partial [bacterium]|nr:PHP domain-containing protein [bacterium]
HTSFATRTIVIALMNQNTIFEYDLHIHTTNSDGELSLEALTEHAIDCGLKGIAITDHDAVGSREQMEFVNNSPLDIIPGIEFATDIANMHLVGYMKDWNNSTLIGFLKEQRAARTAAAEETLKRALDLGIALDWDVLVKDYAKDSPVGRPHIAKYLVDKGHAETVPDAFVRYLGKNRPLYVRKKRYPFARIIDLAKNEFNIIIGLAHPYLIDGDPARIKELINKCVELGIDGIEVHYSGHTEQQIRYLEEICSKHGLLMFGGSDFHGRSIKPDVSLGDGGVFLKDFNLLKDALRRL